MNYTTIRHDCNETHKDLKLSKAHNIRELNDDMLADMKPSIRAALNQESMRFTSIGTNHSFFNSSLFQEPVRHQLMKQRNQKQISNSGNTQIPLDERYISTEATQLTADVRIRSRVEHVSPFKHLFFTFLCTQSKT